MRAVFIGSNERIVDGLWDTWGSGCSRGPAGLGCRNGNGFKKAGVAGAGCGIQFDMKRTSGEIFDEKYRVVAVESQCLVIRGVRSGKVLTIVNPNPETPLTPADYPPGKLIALTDPSLAPLN
jgi:hypothetical protein